jgi:hypothetical protein
LNNFLLKYDPDSFGVAPTLTKLAEVVTKFLQNNNNPQIIEKDLSTLFEKNIDSSNLTNRNSESMLLPDSSEQPTTSEINKTTLSSSQSEEEEEYLDDSIQKSNLSGFDTFGYPLDYRPANNLRSKKPATHASGLANPTRTLTLPKNVSLPSHVRINENFVNKQLRMRTNKYRNTSNSSNNKSNGPPPQNARGLLWKTKKFF